MIENRIEMPCMSLTIGNESIIFSTGMQSRKIYPSFLVENKMRDAHC